MDDDPASLPTVRHDRLIATFDNLDIVRSDRSPERDLLP
jgi:hypothetical protein